eukprot:1597738-Rhodomonas_salina.2
MSVPCCECVHDCCQMAGSEAPPRELLNEHHVFIAACFKQFTIPTTDFIEHAVCYERFDDETLAGFCVDPGTSEGFILAGGGGKKTLTHTLNRLILT